MWDPMWDLIKNILWIYGFICNRHKLVWLMWDKREVHSLILIEIEVKDLIGNCAQKYLSSTITLVTSGKAI